MSPLLLVPTFLTLYSLKANIYIRNFQACIADFGISTIARAEPWVGPSMSSAASLVSFTSGGSLRWTSPELLDPEKFGAVDPRPTKESDRFALGMVIYEVRVRGYCETSRFPLFAKTLRGDRCYADMYRMKGGTQRGSTTR